MTDKDFGSNRQGDLPTEQAVPPVLVACLRAAKGTSLLRKTATSVCPMSAHPNEGWFVRANWSEWQVDASKGGPWSVETVAHLCGRGWAGIHPDSPNVARVTRLGAAVIRADKKATTASAVGTKASAEVNQNNQVIP